MKHIALVVEGPGDRVALPVLVRKYLASREEYRVGIGRPLSANGRDKLLGDDTFEGLVEQAARAPGACAVLVVFDSEGDPVCPLGPDSLGRAQSATGLPVRLCIAVRQFENWIVSSAETVFGEAVAPLANPEGGGATSLVKHELAPTKYVKPIYQPKLTHRMDLEVAAERCPSLARLYRCIDELVLECCPP